jgi:hypothetical protein
MVQYEIRDGITYITCKCYDCTMTVWPDPDGMEYTLLDYREHQTERRENYHAYLENKISTELELAHTKETEALSRELERTGSVPTFFDIGSGELADNTALIGSARWATLHRASIKKA